jgi:hypothetical protein
MTGSALFEFLIALILLAGAVGLFFYAIEGMSPDALFTKIAVWDHRSIRVRPLRSRVE